MRIDILTIFPGVFAPALGVSVLGRALERGVFSVHAHDIRDWTEDRHHIVDDTPYAGGGGMVMKPEPVVRAARAVKETAAAELGAPPPVICLSPQGEMLNARIAGELAALPGMILLCGNYEGIDERAMQLVVDREISIGDYVITGGEFAALILINAVARKIPGVLKNEESAPNDSFENGLLDFPHYTRPETFEGLSVPPILLEGHHAKIVAWRREQALRRTAARRPDLLETAPLDAKDREFLRRLAEENRAEEGG